MTDMDSEQALYRLQRRLKQMGVFTALEREGVHEGSTVRIGADRTDLGLELRAGSPSPAPPQRGGAKSKRPPTIGDHFQSRSVRERRLKVAVEVVEEEVHVQNIVGADGGIALKAASSSGDGSTGASSGNFRSAMESQ